MTWGAAPFYTAHSTGAQPPFHAEKEHIATGLLMSDGRYIYDIDDRLPLRHALVYGLQWAFILFPGLIIAVNVSGSALRPEERDMIRLLQLTLLSSGVFTVIQTLWGHRYPLLEGPSTALVLTFMLLAPQGISVVQGGTILGGCVIVALVLTGMLKRVLPLFTPNVVGGILMLIAFGLLPPLVKFMTGTDAAHPGGDAPVFLISVLLVVIIAGLTHFLRGFWKTVSILIGMILGSLVFFLLGKLSWSNLAAAQWITWSPRLVSTMPAFQWASTVAFGFAFLAVLVNCLGSIQGIARVTDPGRLDRAVPRGILVTGIGGIVCGLLGTVGMVSYSTSPGVVLANRVASRFAITSCGIILLLAAFLPKLAALLSIVPNPVVGAALCVAMGGQVGVGISTVASKPLESRDYFVVGIPVLMGTLVGFLPPPVLDSMPGFLRPLAANGLIVGIALLLLLEHAVMRKAKVVTAGKR